jgi:hypothetical protein
MKRTSLGLAVLAAAGVTIALSPTSASATTTATAPAGTCLQGFVWREARSSDLVCVTPGVRDQTRLDNSLKYTRWVSGPYGPHTCIDTYVWREAFVGDDVCVKPEIRDGALKDNAQAAARKVTAKLWVTAYSDGGTQRLKLNGSGYNYGKVRVYIRFNNGVTKWSSLVDAKANGSFSGGSWGRNTPQLKCYGSQNGYAVAQDVTSGVWSPRVKVAICVRID